MKCFWLVLCVLLFLAGLVLWSIKTGILRFSSFYTSAFKKGCMQQFYLPYPTFDPLDPSHAALMVASYNVSLSNCSALGRFPLPPGAEREVQIDGMSADNITRMFARVIFFPNVKWVIFTGTEFMDEFEMDFEGTQVQPVELTKYQEGMWCHSGFYQVYTSLRTKLLQVVGQDSLPVIVAGHSLGGALSSILNLDIKTKATVTFAAPRVFNPQGASLLDLTRYFNTEDIVPDLPPAVFFDWEYSHPLSGGIFFTKNLGTVEANHVDSYLDYFSL